MDTRVYIEDSFKNEIEVDVDLRNVDGKFVGVYLEGPCQGEEIVLDGFMEMKVENELEDLLVDEI